VETFVVRVFVPAENSGLEPAGFVEHVGSHRVESFRGALGLVDAVFALLGLRREREQES
jgi:hypothetical protein